MKVLSLYQFLFTCTFIIINVPTPLSFHAVLFVFNRNVIKAILRMVVNGSLREPFRIPFRLKHNDQLWNEWRSS